MILTSIPFYIGKKVITGKNNEKRDYRSTDRNDVKILIIQFRPAGDVLLLTPVVELLKERIPDAEIHFLVNEKESQLIEHFPLIDTIIPVRRISRRGLNFLRYIAATMQLMLKVRRERFDIVIDFIGNPRSAQITFLSGAKMRIGRKVGLRSLAYNRRVPRSPEKMNTVLKRINHLTALGIESTYRPPRLHLSEQDKKFASDYIGSLGGDDTRPIIFLAPNSPRPARRWKAESFMAAGKQLVEEYGARVLLAWGPGEEEYTEHIRAGIGGDAEMIPLTNLTEMAAIISHADLMISNCSGTKHIANAVGVRTIAVYGPTDPLVWNDPDRERNPALMADIPCIQCERRVCPFDVHRCMEAVTPDMVMSEVRKMLGAPR
jgi:heptosyltransferase-3